MTLAPDLLTLVRSAGERRGALPLLAVGEQVLGAAAFARAVAATAGGLRSRGFRRGDRLVVLLHRSVDEAVAILAAAAAGGLAVPLNAKLRDEQIRHVLRDCEPWAVVVSATRLLPLRDAPAVLRGQRVFAAGGGLPAAAEPFAALGTGPEVDAAPDPSWPAALLYTSGSTGPQKAVVQDHQNLCLGASIVAGYLGLAADDHLLALLPFSFDYGLNQLLSALHAGCRLTAADHLGTGELAELFLRVLPTGLAGVPSLWHEVARGLLTGALDARHGATLRRATNSGGVLRPEDAAVLRRHWPRVRLFAMYGLTEAFRSAYLDPDEFDAHPDSFGRALPGVELLLVDPASGEVLDGEATGELVHAGALVAKGYWRRPADTAQRFRPDPRGGGGTVVYSGDLVRRDAEGRHYFVGRIDRLLKVQGHRVSPDEVAGAVAGLPGAGEAVAFGTDGGADGHRIVLVVAGDPADRDLVQRLASRCRQRLPSYMLPATILVRRELPHNPNGKLDDAALRALLPPCTGTT
ncbi:MAG: AMP-binding protein [Planctomycetes bacterium]|nr:AMP-binding protein [Planctomycetota bacterium]